MDFEEVFKVVDAAVFVKTQRHLKDVEKFVLWGAWQKQTYEEMATASEYRYTPSYLKQDVGPKLWKLLSTTLGEEVKKTNFCTALERQVKLTAAIQIDEEREIAVNIRGDWGEAVDVSVFYGRTAELAALKQWIIGDRCRLVAVLGMGGIGKTALSIRCTQALQNQFEYLIWRSLSNAPPVEDILADTIRFLSNDREINLPTSIDGKMSLLIYYLRSSRCLLILDNFEAILSSGVCVGRYREGYEGYGELLHRIGEIPSQSCLLVTSREKPEEVALQEGETLPVRSLKLTGLNEAEAEEILKVKGIYGVADDLKKLIDWYRGNPLALKIVSTSIRDLFNGNIAEFLSQGTTLFNGIRLLLEQQFNRLSELEKLTMYWLAINRKPLSISELQDDIVSPVGKIKLLEVLESLGRRSLIEICKDAHGASTFTQQPVLMEYITESALEQIYEEISPEEVKLFLSYARIKATAKDYITESQSRVILTPVAKKLKAAFSSNQAIEDQLNQILLKLYEKFSTAPGYRCGNIINLFRLLKFDLTNYDFSSSNCLVSISS